MSSSAALAADSIRVICGPTASGKSAIAEWLALETGACIISADSRQIYRGFDIGTAKTDATVRARIPHFCIDVANPDERFSAARWAAAATEAIQECGQRGCSALVVGGSGFYLRALFEPLFQEPEFDPRARSQLERQLRATPTEHLRRRCEELDAARAHLGRAQLERAILVATLTGRRLSDLMSERRGTPRFLPHYLVLDPGPPLRAAIGERVDRMLEAGWLDEVRELMRTVPVGAPAWNGTGYSEVLELLSTGGSLPRCRQRIVVATRQYAKRQRTWLRHQLTGAGVTRLSPGQPDIETRVREWWNQNLAA